MKKDTIKKGDLAFAGQMMTCKTNLPTYAAELKLTPDQVNSQAADAVAFDYWVKSTNIMHQDSQQFTTWKDLMRDGGATGMDKEPGVPVLPDPVPAVEPGIEARHRAFIQSCHNNPGYNTAIGTALDMEGSEITPPDLTALLPLLTLLINGNHVEIGWGWQGYAAFLDQLEIQVDRNDGKGFGLLAFDTTPGYTDTQAFPATPAIWTYRAIYRVGDAQVGVWSLPVSVTVPA